MLRLGSVLVLALTAASCGTCPPPVLAGPVTASGPTATATGQEIRVRWSPSRDDVLPEDYYRSVFIRKDQMPAVLRGVKLTGKHEITLQLEGLDAYLRSSRELKLTLYFPDTSQAAKCTHPGAGDMHYAPLVLSFDAAGQVVRAVLGPVHTAYGPL